MTPASVEVPKDLPPRIVIDFANTQFSMAPVTNIGRGSADRVRVALNSRQPLVTRAVIDSKYPVPYRIESSDGALVLVLEETAAGASAPSPARPAAADAPPVPVVVKDVPQAPAPKPVPAQAAEVKPADARPAASQALRRGAEAGRCAVRGPTRQAVHRTPGHVRLPGRRSALGAPDVLGHQRAERRHRPRRSDGDRRHLAARSAVGPGARRHPPRRTSLGYVVEDNVVRIARLEDLAKEEDERQKLIEAQAKGTAAEGLHALAELREGHRRQQAAQGRARRVGARQPGGGRADQHDHHHRSAGEPRRRPKRSSRTSTGRSRRWRSKRASCRPAATTPGRSACSGASTGA